MSLPQTVQADPDFLDKHVERIERWKGLVRNDPRRAVRVLNLSGINSETIEGDKAIDSQYVIVQLREISRDAKSDTWKALVSAGVVGALCKCALNFQAALMKQGSPQMSKKQLADAAREMYAPYFLPLEILCNAAVSGATPPTATEKKLVEELKKQWSSIMQRVWSEPAHSLEPEPKQTRIMERIVVPQLLGRLILFDPTFIDVVMKPTDLTLAVLFRYWMYAASAPDSRMNLAILLPLLEPPLPPHWKTHLDQNPAPPMNILFPRILLGASKAAGSDKKKRTPGQAADAIVSAAAAHLEAFSLQDVQFEYNFFHSLLNHSRTENRMFLRGVYRSAKFWAANAQVMRRAAAEKTPFGEALYTGAFMTYTTMPHTVDEDGKEFIDALVYSWLSTGLFDLLEDTVDVILKIERGAMLLTGVIAAIERWLPQLSLKTTALLRAQFPRPRLMKSLLLPGIAKGEGEKERMERDYQDFVKFGLGAGAQNTMFIQGAWQMLALIGVKVENEEECKRRGCGKKAVDAEGNTEHVCSLCKVTIYCSKKCQESDQVEHRQVCGWLPVIEQTVHGDKPKKVRTAQDPVAGPSNPPTALPSMSRLTLEDLD